ncbi:MAG: DUF3034 family protein [Acidobacteriota bacterium]|nr:DUF3034 family protein [Acidobacteriota bacterium]
MTLHRIADRGKHHQRCWLYFAAAAMAVVLACGLTTPLQAQALGWEGETGVFVTPMAYTASAENQKFHAVVAYHYFNAGPVIGDFHEASVEMGVGKRIEFGYTREIHTFGNDAQGVSYLWQDGFDIFNGKVTVIPENLNKKNWVPAVSVGFMARTNDRNVGNYDAGLPSGYTNGQTNGDIYAVATKAIPVKNGGRLAAVVLNAGVRGTNAELWGMGGNAPDWQARAFGALAFAFKGPSKSTVILGTEASQQPHHPKGFDTLNIPTTLTYCIRVIPLPKYKLNFDAGIAQIAGKVTPGGLDLKARHQLGFQVSYGF